jgi:hypothetical protein
MRAVTDAPQERWERRMAHSMATTIGLTLLGWTIVGGLAKPEPLLANPPERIGGSNFGWYTLRGCDREPFGVIANYQREKATIDDDLRKMFADGQRRLRVPVYYGTDLHIPSALPIKDGKLVAWGRDNLRNLISTVRQTGFQEVIVGSFPLGPNDPTHWKTWHEDRYRENFALIGELRKVMDDSGLTYMLDLQNEGIPFAFQTYLLEYSQRLWHEYIAAYGPTKTIGISAISHPGRLREIPTIYNGVFPQAFDLHLYADAGRALRTADGILRGTGVTDVPFIIGEAYYNDPAEAADLATVAGSIKRRILYLTQWPKARTSSFDDVSDIPLSFGSYRAKGF